MVHQSLRWATRVTPSATSKGTSGGAPMSSETTSPSLCLLLLRPGHHYWISDFSKHTQMDNWIYFYILYQLVGPRPKHLKVQQVIWLRFRLIPTHPGSDWRDLPNKVTAWTFQQIQTSIHNPHKYICRWWPWKTTQQQGSWSTATTTSNRANPPPEL